MVAHSCLTGGQASEGDLKAGWELSRLRAGEKEKGNNIFWVFTGSAFPSLGSVRFCAGDAQLGFPVLLELSLLEMEKQICKLVTTAQWKIPS